MNVQPRELICYGCGAANGVGETHCFACDTPLEVMELRKIIQKQSSQYGILQQMAWSQDSMWIHFAYKYVDVAQKIIVVRDDS